MAIDGMCLEYKFRWINGISFEAFEEYCGDSGSAFSRDLFERFFVKSGKMENFGVWHFSLRVDFRLVYLFYLKLMW